MLKLSEMLNNRITWAYSECNFLIIVIIVLQKRSFECADCGSNQNIKSFVILIYKIGQMEKSYLNKESENPRF